MTNQIKFKKKGDEMMKNYNIILVILYCSYLNILACSDEVIQSKSENIKTDNKKNNSYNNNMEKYNNSVSKDENNDQTSNPLFVDPQEVPIVEAGTIGKCLSFEPIEGKKVCLLDVPQSKEINNNISQKYLLLNNSTLPESVSIKRDVIDSCEGFEIHNQDRTGWCSAHAVAAAMEILICKQTGGIDRVSQPHLWMLGKGIENGCKGGWFLSSAVRTAVSYKIIPSNYWSFVNEYEYCEENLQKIISQKPEDIILKEKAIYRITSSYLINENDEHVWAIKRALLTNNPVVYSVPVFRGVGWDSHEELDSIQIPPEGKGECNCKCLCSLKESNNDEYNKYCKEPVCCEDDDYCKRGYHSIVIIGYNNNSSTFTLLNSWGKNWKESSTNTNDGGFFNIDYAYINKYKRTGIVIKEVDNEICDLLDNDYDGETDEGDLCNNGQKCEHGECVSTCTPSEEICDGEDNDCDDDIDENCDCISPETKPCGTDIGECQKGIIICIDGNWSECTTENGPKEEICDNKDNDCDGQTDEGFDDLGNLCFKGLGVTLHNLRHS